MKPENWDTMTDRQKREYAIELLASTRGQYIVGQALAIASETLRDAKPYPELSNAEDMDTLKVLFFPYAEVQALTKVPNAKA